MIQQIRAHRSPQTTYSTEAYLGAVKNGSLSNYKVELIQSKTDAKQPTRYVRLPELLRMVPFSAATVYRKVKAKQMPAPIKFGERVSAWNREEVERWLAMQEVA